MAFLEVLNTYFRGEKLEAWFFILPVGVLLLAFGIVPCISNRNVYSRRPKKGEALLQTLLQLESSKLPRFGSHR